MRTRPVLAIALLAFTASVAAGCDVLYSMMLPAPNEPYPSLGPELSFDPNASGDPGGSPPPPLATYEHGTATVTIGRDAPVALDHLVNAAQLVDDFGLVITWTDTKGIYLRLAAYDDTLGEGSLVSIDRIADGQHWTSLDSSDACKVTYTHKADATGVAGTASCHGLRWSDMMSFDASTDGEPFIPGEPPFDLEATFSAAP